MPTRHNNRRIDFTVHAVQRLALRKVAEEHVRTLVRALNWTPEATAPGGDPKWSVQAGIGGKLVRVVFVETAQGTLEILLVVTVITP